MLLWMIIMVNIEKLIAFSYEKCMEKSVYETLTNVVKNGQPLPFSIQNQQQLDLYKRIGQLDSCDSDSERYQLAYDGCLTRSIHGLNRHFGFVIIRNKTRRVLLSYISVGSIKNQNPNYDIKMTIHKPFIKLEFLMKNFTKKAFIKKSEMINLLENKNCKYSQRMTEYDKKMIYPSFIVGIVLSISIYIIHFFVDKFLNRVHTIAKESYKYPQ